ncbi:U32 family peptidase [Lyngbya confervoides]|uniref:U32 family peptidase n=1 Tax=Lyngbya confervoides BDU141951 TaxID=1574623 RepID=A0ABD4T8C5_9CYAN|nr:U32 family peptidase [Lyngbya confervoides]MCM1984876.1 U32 family peptidase [Lyngbya confervoides BDU141951]
MPDPQLSPGPELLAPAGDWDCVKAAVENGADAVYFGLDQFNARMRAQNFTESDLPALMTFLHRRGVKGYLTLNTLIFTAELPAVETYLRHIIAAGVDAAIVQDVGLCRLIRHLSPDFPIHASTQMTVTSAAGVEFAADLGCERVVLARESSLKDIEKIQAQLRAIPITIPLEVFVHGALCVAYSGQCLTSEALGGRSANRGECAQACRVPYALVVDGKEVDLGDRRYLLSPQDLAGLEVLPELVQTGVSCLKIEGRLKSAEYVANVTRIYRQALDQILQERCYHPTPDHRYRLEMAFSRGLYTGWLRGIDNQTLVHGRFGKKRGVYVGEVIDRHQHRITLRLEAPLKPGDGVVFDRGNPAEAEEGGRIYTIEQQGSQATITLGPQALNLQRIRPGDKLWKTNDPELDKQVRQTYKGDRPQFRRPLSLEAYGQVGEPLRAVARDDQGHCVQVCSQMPLVAATHQPLTPDRLAQQWGRLGNTPFELRRLHCQISEACILPVSELNRMRRDLVHRLEAVRSQALCWQQHPQARSRDLMPQATGPDPAQAPELVVLVRSLPQLEAALASGIQVLLCELEDPRTYRQAVQQVRDNSAPAEIWVAPPRITKPRETWILDQVKRSQADGYLVRNYDQLRFFSDQRCRGDFSLNVTHPITAAYFMDHFRLERLTASYDLNIQQLLDLIGQSPADWYEITLHQHMPMFHMEHCVFCAFLSSGKDFRDCGRPCETHQVKLRDRRGVDHILQADAGCRNTLFNGNAQTGAESIQSLLAAGARQFRLEFLQESPQTVQRTIALYQQLLRQDITGTQLWKTLHLQNQLGVTRGSLGRG